MKMDDDLKKMRLAKLQVDYPEVLEGDSLLRQRVQDSAERAVMRIYHGRFGKYYQFSRNEYFYKKNDIKGHG